MESQLKFEVVLRTPLGEIFSDVLYLSFFRTPLLKSSSYAVLRINLTPVIIQQMINDLANNIYEKFRIEIYTITDSKDKNKRVSMIFNKMFDILYVKPLEPLKFDKSTYQCYLVLVNPFLHYMSTANTYNRILESMTAYDAIKDFEKSITTTHGNIFYFNHVGVADEKNNYRYEQMLVKAENDLAVPVYLINTYKPFNTFNFYFFDDFYLSDDSDNELTCHLLNLYNIDQLKSYNILEYADICSSTRKLNSYPISDQFLNLDKEDQTFTVTNREMLYSTQKSFKSSLPKHPQKVTTKNQELVKDRFIKTGEFIDPIQASKNSQSSQHANLYSPDDPTNALYRFELLKKFFMTKLDYIQVYETSNCLPDWCQFGKRYNMDIEDSSSYIFTPINIVNIFTRTSLKEKYCKHLARYSMLKFIIGEEPDYSFWKESKYVREA